MQDESTSIERQLRRLEAKVMLHGGTAIIQEEMDGLNERMRHLMTPPEGHALGVTFGSGPGAAEGRGQSS